MEDVVGEDTGPRGKRFSMIENIPTTEAKLLPALRSNSVNVTGNFDGFRVSKVAEKDIPAGWIKK